MIYLILFFSVTHILWIGNKGMPRLPGTCNLISSSKSSLLNFCWFQVVKFGLIVAFDSMSARFCGFLRTSLISRICGFSL